MKIKVIGVPMDLGADRRGVDIGANAIRYAGLNEQLRYYGHEVVDTGNVIVPIPENAPIGNPHLKFLEPILQVAQDTASITAKILNEGFLPLILGGDHSIALGSVTGAASASKNGIGVIWVDAHGDFNTPDTTPSGNIHGMVLAALAGFGDPRLTNFFGFAPKVRPENIVLVGVRDLDLGERELLRTKGPTVFTMPDIDRQGIAPIIEQAIAIATHGVGGFHLSFDMDSLDPREAMGVGTPVRGGISYREAHLLMEIISDSKKLSSLELVEVNPILDQENKTAKLAVELILSALGKKIF